jgi:hypothetical protein
MYRITETYVDFNGNERTEDFYFNLTKAEVLDMEMGVSGGLAESINRLVQTQDQPAILQIFKDIVKKSYGVKSPDGRRFIKNEEVLNDFIQTEAFSNIYVRFATNADEAAKFINGIIPADMSKQIAKA